MEEYEVDLRDYLRVMWQKKWIILVALLAAIVATLLLSFRLPSRYEAVAFYQLNQAPKASAIKLDAPSLEVATVMLSSQERLWEAVEKLGRADLPAGAVTTLISSGLKVAAQKGDLLQLELRGALPPDLLCELLNNLIELFSARVREQLQGQIREELLRIGQRRKWLESEQAKLVGEIDELLRREGRAQLKVGEFEATLEGFALRQELSGLHGRLIPIQQELDGLRLAQEELNDLASQDWEPLLIITPPYSSAVPIGPNRAMNIVLAGVLGLFGGILLAFFIHYMEGGKRIKKGKE